MSITGYMKNDGRRDGGLAQVWLVCIDDVLMAQYDKSQGYFTGLVMTPGAVLAKYDFEEDSASYSQMLRGAYPFELVKHELAFRLPCLDKLAVAGLQELLKANSGGFVAIVKTTVGEVFLVGWSVEFGREAPLRVSSAKVDSRADYGEDSFCEVRLTSEDVSFAKPYVGSYTTRVEDVHNEASA